MDRGSHAAVLVAAALGFAYKDAAGREYAPAPRTIKPGRPRRNGQFTRRSLTARRMMSAGWRKYIAAVLSCAKSIDVEYHISKLQRSYGRGEDAATAAERCW